MTLTRLERAVFATLGASAALALLLLVLLGMQIRRHNATLAAQLETVWRLTPRVPLERDPTADQARDGPPVDANLATREELQAAGSIGKALAQHIIELRAANGGRLTSISQLATLRGLTRAKLARLGRRLTFGDPVPGRAIGSASAYVGVGRPSSGSQALAPDRIPQAPPPAVRKVNVNVALEAELAAVPHIGIDLARRIIALRDQRGGSFRSLDELLDVEGVSDKSLTRLVDHLDVR